MSHQQGGVSRTTCVARRYLDMKGFLCPGSLLGSAWFGLYAERHVHGKVHAG